MDLKVLRKLNMRRRISCSRAASKYCWGVKYGMAFFGGEDTVDGGWGSSPKRAVCGFLFFLGYKTFITLPKVSMAGSHSTAHFLWVIFLIFYAGSSDWGY